KKLKKEDIEDVEGDTVETTSSESPGEAKGHTTGVMPHQTHHEVPKSGNMAASNICFLQDPEFYQFLKEHDKELLEFDVEDVDEDVETDMDDEDMQEDEEDDAHHMEHVASAGDKEEKASSSVITSAMVDSWCNSIQENGRVAAIRSLLKAFRTACHYGDDSENESSTKLSVMSSSVFNRIMMFVLSEMDGILRTLLKLPPSGGKKEMITDLTNKKQWKNYNHLVKSYLGNALHVLNQMTDTEMISFTLRRLRYSSIFLAAFPSLLRKYVKVALHFWGTGGGALPVVSFLFLRDICIRLGSDCVDECFKGIYKAYVLNCKFVNAIQLKHLQFLGNCVTELFRVDLPAAYQHAFLFIRQLAMILREALTMKPPKKKVLFLVMDLNQVKKARMQEIGTRLTFCARLYLCHELLRKVYEWKYMNCLELWTAAICAYSSEADFMPLAYPLTQIISGVARLVPTARYFPLRLRCVRMLNRIAASTGTFIPVAQLLLDMLEMKELNRPPTGGVSKAVDLRTVLKVNKPTLKTQSFQEACIFTVVEELTEHLAQWSYSVAFFELSFVPTVRLRNFCKSTKVERFRREMRQLIRQIEANSEFTNEKRRSISYLPNDPSATSFLEDEKNSGVSPLSQYAAALRLRAQQRTDSLSESSVQVGEHAAVFRDNISESDEDDGTRNEQGAAVFSSSWLPGEDSKTKHINEKEKKKRRKELQEGGAIDEDVVEELVLSSDEDEDGSGSDTASGGDVEAEPVPRKQPSKKQKPFPQSSKRKSQFHAKKSNKRKRAN
ncbi:hypothetical protein RJ640_000795, partial [Escallonia rubra]